MLKEKNFIVVPYWAHESLKRHGLDLKEVVDFCKARTVLSNTDLAELIAIQSSLGYLVGDANGLYSTDALLRAWSDSMQTAEERSLYSNTLIPLSMDQATQTNAHSRLYDATGRRERDEYPFIIYDIAPTIGAIVVYPGHFTSAQPDDLQFRALEGILEVLYAYNADTEVALTPWFRQYLVGLSQGGLSA